MRSRPTFQQCLERPHSLSGRKNLTNCYTSVRTRRFIDAHQGFPQQAVEEVHLDQARKGEHVADVEVNHVQPLDEQLVRVWVVRSCHLRELAR